ncbi:MAG: hypothetical protein LBO64_08875 [Desulfovibrio sp.]|nr:hypothetical protein [Desulfovibrio sp.]
MKSIVAVFWLLFLVLGFAGLFFPRLGFFFKKPTPLKTFAAYLLACSSCLLIFDGLDKREKMREEAAIAGAPPAAQAEAALGAAPLDKDNPWVIAGIIVLGGVAGYGIHYYRLRRKKQD